MPVVDSHGKYLGLPSIVGKRKSEIFSHLKFKVWDRISTWNDLPLSRAGREILIKSVLQAIPSYAMTCFKLPDTLLDDIVSLLVGYWWGKKNDQRKIPWVAWKKLTRSKKDGGLGFRDLRTFNLALLAKQGWRLVTQPQSLVARLLKAKYYPHGSFWEAQLGSRPSFSWRSIFNARKVLVLGSRKRIFSGATTSILDDLWLPRSSNFRVTDTLIPCSNAQMVSSLINRSNSTWNESLIRSMFHADEVDLILSMVVNSGSSSDRWIWHFAKNGKFTVKSAYHVLHNSSLLENYAHPGSTSTNNPQPVSSKLWKIHIPPRITHFIWRCCNNSLPTADNLSRRGVQVEGVCPFCRVEDGSGLHLFFRCPFTRQVWQAAGVWHHVNQFAQPVFELWIRELVINGSSSTIDYIAMLLYGIWIARNKCIFQERGYTVQSIIASSSRILSDFKEAWGWPEIPSSSLSDIKLRLPRCCWRIFFDAGVSACRNCSGVGVWVQSPSDEFVVGVCQRLDHITDPEVAEFLELKLAISTGIDMKLDSFTVAGDALGVLQAFLDPNLSSISTLPILEHINSMIPSTTVVTPCWIGRGNNSTSHEFAFYAKNMECNLRSWSEIPPFIVSLSAG